MCCGDCGWPEFVRDVNRVKELAEELPEEAEEFQEGVTEKLEGMQTWADENCHVTDKMKEAKENIEEGIRKWLRD
jgi:hypothetical protein